MAHSVYPWRVRRCSERQFEADEKRSNYFPCSFRPSILLQVRYLLNQFEHLDFQTRGMINLSLGGNRGYVALRKRRPLAQGCRNVFNRLKVKEDNTKAIRTSREYRLCVGVCQIYLSNPSQEGTRRHEYSVFRDCVCSTFGSLAA